MLRLVVLISGGGSNLRALLESIRNGELNAHVVAVGSDRDADGLVHAEHFGIPRFIVPLEPGSNRDSWGSELIAAITPWKPDLIVLSGFMRLLPAHVVDAFAPALLNTHPAYLPEFPGAHGVRDALAAGAKRTGASIIVVDTTIDGGPIVAQERVAILPDDTASTLHDRIKLVERRLLADTVRKIADGTMTLKEFAHK